MFSISPKLRTSQKSSLELGDHQTEPCPLGKPKGWPSSRWTGHHRPAVFQGIQELSRPKNVTAAVRTVTTGRHVVVHVSEVQQKQFRIIKPSEQARCFLSEATGQPELVICFGTGLRHRSKLEGCDSALEQLPRPENIHSLVRIQWIQIFRG